MVFLGTSLILHPDDVSRRGRDRGLLRTHWKSTAAGRLDGELLGWSCCCACELFQGSEQIWSNMGILNILGIWWNMYIFILLDVLEVLIAKFDKTLANHVDNWMYLYSYLFLTLTLGWVKKDRARHVTLGLPLLCFVCLLWIGWWEKNNRKAQTIWW